MTISDPVAVELLGLGHRKEPRWLAIILGLVHRFRLQSKRLGIRFVEAGIIILAIDPQRDRHQTHAPLGQKFDHTDCTRMALGPLGRRRCVGRRPVLTMSHLRPLLGNHQIHQEEHGQQCTNGPVAQNAI